MKNRVVKQLLTVCMVTALSVSMPMASWAADNKKETAETVKEEKKDDTIEITKDSVGTSVYDKNGVKITIQKLSREENYGNPFFQIKYMIENNSSKDVTISMYDSYVDDFNVGTYGGNTIDAGKKGVADLSVWEKDYKPYDIDDFKIWDATLKISDTDGVLLESDINIQRDAFTGDIDDSQQSATEGTQVDDQNDELSQKIETLETQNKELEDKNNELENKNNKLESKNSELDGKNQELESKNSELESKNQELANKNSDLESKNKELEDKLNQAEEEKKQEETEPTAAPTETPVEDTPAPEPTQEEAAPEAEQKPVVEYKDATTIRIVQQALNDAGYNCGNPDGVAGGKTTEAVTKYQTDKGLTVNGLVTDELLQSLNVVEKVQDAVQKEASKGEYGGDYTYDQLARNPDTYKNQKIKISGKVLQAEYDDDICYARIAMNNDYNTVVFVTYSSDLLNYRLLEDDKVTVYGVSYGVYSYKAVSGATITIPWLNADMIEM